MKDTISAQPVTPGTLYLVGTPIGNLSDISERALNILSQVDFILCEDTRHSGILLEHFGIHKKLISYFAHNESMRTDQFLPALKSGQTAALITDAGMPGISDPGSRLADACLDAGLRVCPVPGACACTAAVAASGFHQFVGFEFAAFFPRKSSERQEMFKKFAGQAHLLVGYESPQRIASLIADLIAVLGPDRRVCLCRELTKKFETVERCSAQKMLEALNETPCKGELCLVIEGEEKAEMMPAEETISPEAQKLADILLKRGLSTRDIRDIASEYTGIKPKIIYQYLIHLSAET